MFKSIFKIERKYLAGLVAIVICVVISSLLPPQVLKVIVDDFLMAGKSQGLLLIGFIYLGSFVLVGFFDFLKGWLLTTVGQTMVKNVRSQMQRKLTRMETGYFTSCSSGQIHSRFMSDVDNISALFTSGIISLLIDCLKIVGIIASIWMFSRQLGVFALAIVPAVGLLTKVFKDRMGKSQRDNLKELGKVNNHINESIKNILMIKSFHREDYMEKRYGKYLSENYHTMNKVNFYDSCYSPIIQVLTACCIGFILYLAMGGTGNVLGISIGEITASINLITNLFSPIDSLGTELAAIEKGFSGVRSVRAFMEEPEEREKQVYQELSENEITIEFNHLTFSYDGKKQVIKDFHQTVRPGENVAVIGRTGAGKTTLFKLTTGLLSPTSGQVLLNGIPAWQIASSQKRKIFGYVQQSFSFVEGTVWEQISLGDESLTREDITAAIEFAGLTETVQSLAEGFDTRVKPEMFSQGQKQLLAIARAIAADPKVLLLDEVTANLDSVTEEKVVEVLKKAGRGRTILSIAHRPSTIASAERIIRI